MWLDIGIYTLRLEFIIFVLFEMNVPVISRLEILASILDLRQYVQSGQIGQLHSYSYKIINLMTFFTGLTLFALCLFSEKKCVDCFGIFFIECLLYNEDGLLKT